MWNRSICRLAFSLLLPALPLRPESLTVVAGDYPPFFCDVVLDGVTPVEKGMFIDFIHEFSREFPRYTFKVVAVPRKRMDTMMLNGEAQVFSLNNPMFVARNKSSYIWSEAVWHTADTLVSVRGNNVIFEKPEDLFGMTIGKLSGNGYGRYDLYFASGTIKAQDANSYTSLINMAIAGRIDAFFGNVQSMPYLIERAGYFVSQFEFSPVSILEFDLHIQLNRRQARLRNDLNKFIAKSKTDGFLQRLEAKYRK